MTATSPRRPVSATGEAESIGELSRLVASLKADIHEDLEEIKARFDRLDFVSPAVYAADRHTDQERHNALAARVAKLESANQWLTRTLGGTIVTIIAGAIWALATAGHP